MSDIAELTLSVDSDQLKRGERDLNSFSRQAKKTEDVTKKSTSAIGSSFAMLASPLGMSVTAISAVATGLIGLGAKAAQFEDHFSEISKIAGIANNEFKSLAYAFEASGVSMESLAEHSRKAVKELGQFQLTGAGGFKDALDAIKGKSDLTAESLRGLSGPDVLQKLKNAFDQANIPIGQQQQLMDGVSRGAGQLIPLLENGGESIKKLTDRYNQFNAGLTINPQASSQLGDIADDFDLLGATIKNAGVYLANEFQPELQRAIEYALTKVPEATQAAATFFDLLKHHDDIHLAGFTFKGTNVDEMRDLNAVSIKVAESFEKMNEQEKELNYQLAEAAKLQKGSLAEGEHLQLAAIAKATLLAEEMTHAAYLKQKDALIGINEEEAKRAKAAADKQAAEDAAADRARKAKEAAEKLNAEINSQVSALERAQSTWGMTSSQIAVYDITMKGASKSTIEHANAIATEIDRLDAQKIAAENARVEQEKLDEAKKRAGKAFETVVTGLKGETGNQEIDGLREKYAEKQAVIDEAMATRYNGQAAHDAAMQLLTEKQAVAEKAVLDKQAKEKEAAALQTRANIVSITSTQIEQMKGLFQEGSGIAKAFFVASQSLAAANSIIYGYQSAMALQTAYAEMGVQIGNPLAFEGVSKVHQAAAIGMGYTSAGMIMGQTLASFDGGGFTGKGSRTGGIDGKGGMLSIMHPNETVLDHTKGQGMGAPIINVIEDASKAGRTQSRNMDGKNVIDIFVANIRADGQARKAIKSAFGLSDAGR